MSSKVDICNMAIIGYVGGAQIGSMSDNSSEARSCALLFDSCRDVVLCAAQWSFATTRTTLARLADSPDFGWGYQYQLPSDCLKPLLINGSDQVPWRKEGRKILTNEENVELLYTREISEVGSFDPFFIDTLAVYLAAMIVVPIARDFKMQRELLQLYTFKLSVNAGMDADFSSSKETRPDMDEENYSWLKSR